MKVVTFLINIEARRRHGLMTCLLRIRSTRKLHKVRSFSAVGDEVKRVSFCVHGVKVILAYPQDITSSRVAEALVVPTNSFLCGSSNKDYWLFKSRKNVETRVHEECGQSLQGELDSLPFINEDSKNKAAVTAVVKTLAYGNLKHMQNLYHVVVPRTYSTVNDSHIDQLRQSYQNCMSMAFEESGVKNLGMPALGCGIGAMEPQISCEEFVRAVEGFSRNKESNKSSLLIEISFIEKKPFAIWQKSLSSLAQASTQ